MYSALYTMKTLEFNRIINKQLRANKCRYVKSYKTGPKTVKLWSKASFLCLMNIVENTKIKVITNMWKILWDLYLLAMMYLISLYSFHISYSWKPNSSPVYIYLHKL